MVLGLKTSTINTVTVTKNVRIHLEKFPSNYYSDGNLQNLCKSTLYRLR